MASFGEELRRQRELRAVSLREISDATKINIRFLEALEQNDFKHLPGGQFNKGFIRAYARHIGVSGDDMVNAYLLELRTEDDGSRPPARVAPVGDYRRIDFNPRILVAATLAILALGTLAAITVSIVKFARRTESASSSSAPTSGTTPSANPQGTRGPQGQPAEAHAQSGVSDRGAGSPAEGPAAGERLTSPALPSSDGTQAPPPGGAGDVTGGSVDRTGTRSSSAQGQVQPSETSKTSDTSDTGVVSPSRGSPDGDTAAGRGKLALRVIPFHAIRFDLLCNGASIHSGILAVGVPASFECAGVYEVSLEDAGAVSMTVNGDRIYLGRPGQSLAGRHISAANYRDFANAPSEAIPR